MKLLVIYHAGCSQDAKNIFQEYVKQGVDLTVIVPKGAEISKEQQMYRQIEIGFKGVFKFIPFFLAIKSTKPDVIQVFDEYTSTYLFQTIFCRNILYGKRVPVFAYAFQNIPFLPPPFIFTFSIQAFKRLIYKISYRFILWYHKKNVSGVLGSNQQALLQIKELNSKIPTKLVFWGVDIKKFFSKNRDACREKLGLKAQKDIMLAGYIGRIIEEKGLHTLLLAASRASNFSVMFVGDGNFKSELLDLVGSLHMNERVFFFNGVKQTELVEFYNALDVFVLPSKTMPGWKEQYGRVLIEAMACGLPVIGSSSGAISEVLAGYPKGLIFKEGDVGDLVQKMQQASSLTVPENFNLADFLHKFSVEHFVLESLKFYKNHD